MIIIHLTLIIKKKVENAATDTDTLILKLKSTQPKLHLTFCNSTRKKKKTNKELNIYKANIFILQSKRDKANSLSRIQNKSINVSSYGQY